MRVLGILVLLYISKCKSESHQSRISKNDNLIGNLKTVYKCCASEKSINLINSNVSFDYECTDALGKRSIDPVVPMQIVPWDTNIVYGFPESCEPKQLKKSNFKSLMNLNGDYCIDKIFDENPNTSNVTHTESLIVLSCKSSVPPTKHKIPNYRSLIKCCIGNMVYDAIKHTCVHENTTHEKLKIFDDFFRKITVLDVKYKIQSCSMPKVLIDYVVESKDIEMLENTIKLTTSGKTISLEDGSFCIDKNIQGHFVVRGCRDSCEGEVCVTKCCPEGYIFIHENDNCNERAVCSPTNSNEEEIFEPRFHDMKNLENPVLTKSPKTLGIRYSSPCIPKIYILSQSDPRDTSYLDISTGNLIIPFLTTPVTNYCVETVRFPCSNVSLETFVCMPDFSDKPEKKTKFHFYSIGLTISCIFLAITLLVYILLPALRNLHGRTLMCELMALLVGYACLAKVQSSSGLQDNCKMWGYSIYFCSLAAFSWLNVMCFDIWRTFGNIRSSLSPQQRERREMRRFLWFSTYAWGFPLTMTLVTLLLDEFDVMRGVLDPEIGGSQCWFSEKVYPIPVLILFNLPVGIQTVINISFFVLTAIHCNKVKSEIHRMQAGSMEEKCKKRFLSDKEKYVVNLKLFFVMGLSWTFEVILPFFDNIYIVAIMDCMNIFRGVFIFCVLILKRKIYLLLRNKYGSKI